MRLSVELGAGRIAALHVNHGLRESAAADSDFCLALCERLSIDCQVEKRAIDRADGNVEASAREARYRIAESVRAERGLDLIATGHTASDQAETVLYRLAASPGRRSLLGIAERSGRLIRPLLVVTRSDTHDYCRAEGLGGARTSRISILRWRATASATKSCRRCARSTRPPSRTSSPRLRSCARRPACSTLALREALERCSAGGSPPAVEASALAGLAPPLRRLVLRHLAEQAAGDAAGARPGRARPSWSGWRSSPAAPTSTCPAASGPPASTA